MLKESNQYEGYYSRKSLELELLSKLCNDNEKFAPKSYQDVIDAKFFLKEKLRRKSIRSNYSVSNLSGKKKNNFYGFNIDYSYSRSNFKIETNDFFKLIHKNIKLKHPYDSDGYFTNCGQSSISCLLYALNLLAENFQIKKLTDDIYYETEDFLSLFPKSNKKTEKDILFIDSSTTDLDIFPLLDNIREKTKLSIIDTTCYSLGSTKLSEILNYLLKYKIPIFLCRSHHKLDCLGLEYAPLGSLITIYPKEIKSNFLKEIPPLIQKSISNFGAAPLIEHLYPFHNDLKFHELSEMRIKKLRINNQIFYQNLKGRKGIKKFDHDLFNWVILKKDVSKEELGQSLVKFCEKISQFGIPTKLTESFGWDFNSISILQFNNYTKGDFFGNDLLKIRVALTDFPISETEIFIKFFHSWLKDFEGALVV